MPPSGWIDARGVSFPVFRSRFRDFHLFSGSRGNQMGTAFPTRARAFVKPTQLPGQRDTSRNGVSYPIFARHFRMNEPRKRESNLKTRIALSRIQNSLNAGQAYISVPIIRSLFHK